MQQISRIVMITRQISYAMERHLLSEHSHMMSLEVGLCPMAQILLWQLCPLMDIIRTMVLYSTMTRSSAVCLEA